MPIFSDLESETIRVLTERSFIHNLPSGHTLLIEGMPAESGYFLVSGDLRVHRMNREGRMQVLARVRPGSPVNLISLLLPGKTNRASVDTLSPSSVLVIDGSDFDDLITHYHDFSKRILQYLAGRMAKMTDLAAGLSLYTVRARLARFLIELADQPESAGGWTQDEIAAHIGTVRDVVGRLLREFEHSGLIQRERHQILLVDRDRLNAEAEMLES